MVFSSGGPGLPRLTSSGLRKTGGKTENASTTVPTMPPCAGRRGANISGARTGRSSMIKPQPTQMPATMAYDLQQQARQGTCRAWNFRSSLIEARLRSCTKWLSETQASARWRQLMNGFRRQEDQPEKFRHFLSLRPLRPHWGVDLVHHSCLALSSQHVQSGTGCCWRWCGLVDPHACLIASAGEDQTFPSIIIRSVRHLLAVGGESVLNTISILMRTYQNSSSIMPAWKRIHCRYGPKPGSPCFADHACTINWQGLRR